MNSNTPADLIPAAEARVLLGVSHDKMWRLLKTGALKQYRDIRDLRLKLVSRSEVEALKIPFEKTA